ncbi:MAG: hypothetical protein ACYDAG_08180 [Chloroflexota bacterium]
MTRASWRALGLGLVLLLAACSPAALGPAGPGSASPAGAPPLVARAAPASMQIDLLKGWSFKTDPTSAHDWSSPQVNDASWDVIDAGSFWQAQGYAGYAGVAWYRRWVFVPPGWKDRPAYLAIGGVNDEYTVFVNGRRFGQVGSLANHQSAVSRPTATPVRLLAGQPNLIAVRVRSWYNFGGLVHGPVALTTSPAMPASPASQAKAYARTHSRGIWPGWMNGRGRSWTAIAAPDGGPQSLEGPDGSWEATVQSPAVSAWVADARTGKLLIAPPLATSGRGSLPKWSLMDGHLPVLESAWRANGVRLHAELWRDGSAAQSSAQWRLRLRDDGGPRHLVLYVAVRPYQVQPGVAPLYSLSLSGTTVLANGVPALATAAQPSRILASTASEGDVSELITTRSRSMANAASDASGYASLALAYDVNLSPGSERTFAFAAPVLPAAVPTHGSSVDTAAPLFTPHFPTPAVAAARWQSLLRVGGIRLPDRQVTDAYYASLAYILMSRDGNVPHPGPLLHDAFWYRDSTYMLAALERNGNLGQARRLLQAMVRFQQPDGEFPANVSTHRQVGHPRGAEEWDAQGEGIHALVDYYRYSHDRAWLATVWPNIDSAAGWMERLRSTQPSGLLPPGESAEDLGPADQVHYWDDFWGAIGLRDAAFAAGALGHSSASARLSAQGADLLRETMSAAAPDLARYGIIPNGPSDAISPAAARGSTPAVWPGQLLPAATAQPIFRRYFDRYVRPYGGAFRHADGNFWPFGDLELAHAALFLGMPGDASLVLRWQLAHQTANGVYAWGDEVSRDGRQLLGGDMPHGWTAAEYVSLVRDMLLYEHGNRLEIAAGVPAAWLGAGGAISVSDMPTHFGRLSYQIHRSGGTILLDLSAQGTPPGGYVLHLPYAAHAISVDGATFRPVPSAAVTRSSSALPLPPAARHIEVRLG